MHRLMAAITFMAINIITIMVDLITVIITIITVGIAGITNGQNVIAIITTIIIITPK